MKIQTIYARFVNKKYFFYVFIFLKKDKEIVQPIELSNRVIKVFYEKISSK